MVLQKVVINLQESRFHESCFHGEGLGGGGGGEKLVPIVTIFPLNFLTPMYST